eukprot:TRINITY_DN4584_c1_g3_i1.p1 TRINITY_DN4584_c1_g3~~TRINITY_DN4584_c1_g3_i1.p1  ORF type:complete len:895 (+),score=283.81 TRINITY_DN4584_c1_g3_i1:81-2765(+)
MDGDALIAAAHREVVAAVCAAGREERLARKAADIWLLRPKGRAAAWVSEPRRVARALRTVFARLGRDVRVWCEAAAPLELDIMKGKLRRQRQYFEKSMKGTLAHVTSFIAGHPAAAAAAWDPYMDPMPSTQLDFLALFDGDETAAANMHKMRAFLERQHQHEVAAVRCKYQAAAAKKDGELAQARARLDYLHGLLGHGNNAPQTPPGEKRPRAATPKPAPKTVTVVTPDPPTEEPPAPPPPPPARPETPSSPREARDAEDDLGLSPRSQRRELRSLRQQLQAMREQLGVVSSIARRRSTVFHPADATTGSPTSSRASVSPTRGAAAAAPPGGDARGAAPQAITWPSPAGGAVASLDGSILELAAQMATPASLFAEGSLSATATAPTAAGTSPPRAGAASSSTAAPGFAVPHSFVAFAGEAAAPAPAKPASRGREGRGRVGHPAAKAKDEKKKEKERRLRQQQAAAEKEAAPRRRSTRVTIEAPPAPVRKTTVPVVVASARAGARSSTVAAAAVGGLVEETVRLLSGAKEGEQPDASDADPSAVAAEADAATEGACRRALLDQPVPAATDEGGALSDREGSDTDDPRGAARPARHALRQGAALPARQALPVSRVGEVGGGGGGGGGVRGARGFPFRAAMQQRQQPSERAAHAPAAASPLAEVVGAAAAAAAVPLSTEDVDFELVLHDDAATDVPTRACSHTGGSADPARPPTARAPPAAAAAADFTTYTLPGQRREGRLNVTAALHALIPQSASRYDAGRRSSAASSHRAAAEAADGAGGMVATAMALIRKRAGTGGGGGAHAARPHAAAPMPAASSGGDGGRVTWDPTFSDASRPGGGAATVDPRDAMRADPEYMAHLSAASVKLLAKRVRLDGGGGDDSQVFSLTGSRHHHCP